MRNVKLIIVDEVHEYKSLSAGLVSNLIKIIKQLSNPTIILSSATIPEPKKLASKLADVDEIGVLHHDFFQYINNKVELIGKRLVIVCIFDMNPNYSWSTYVQLWSVMMAFLHYAYLMEKKFFTPQSIVFVNNIKELRRIHRGFEENIYLGEPIDHLKLFNPLDAYSYSHYLSQSNLENIINKIYRDGRLNDLLHLVDEMHSLVSSRSRDKVINALKIGKGLAVVLSTSSLELGVDYDNVSFILNSGVDSAISLAQRFGRGGRSNTCLRTTLGIIFTRKIPQEAFLLYDVKTWDRLHTDPKKYVEPMPVTTDNPQVIKRKVLTEAIVNLALEGNFTYASKEPITSIEKLKNFLAKVKGKIGE